MLHALNESATSPVFWSTTEVDALIDEAAEVLAEEGWSVKRTAFVPLEERKTYYHLRVIAPDAMAPWRIWLHDIGRRLEAWSMTALDHHHETWITVTGDPAIWVPVSAELFAIWPTPAAGGGVLRVDYLAWPRALLDDDDEPEGMEADHDALVQYGVYDGLCKRWDARRAMEVWALFSRSWLTHMDRAGQRRMQARITSRDGAETEGPSPIGLP